MIFLHFATPILALFTNMVAIIPVTRLQLSVWRDAVSTSISRRSTVMNLSVLASSILPLPNWGSTTNSFKLISRKCIWNDFWKIWRMRLRVFNKILWRNSGVRNLWLRYIVGVMEKCFSLFWRIRRKILNFLSLNASKSTKFGSFLRIFTKMSIMSKRSECLEFWLNFLTITFGS